MPDAGAFEMRSGHDRIVVNCGAAGLAQPNWNGALRATAAHSTLIVADTSSAAILPAGLARDLLGPRLVGGPAEPVAPGGDRRKAGRWRRCMTPMPRPFGLRHERQITMSPQGLMVTGATGWCPSRPRRPGRAAPSRSASISIPMCGYRRLEGGGILLKLPNGEGWRFRAGGGNFRSRKASIWAGRWCAGPSSW